MKNSRGSWICFALILVVGALMRFHALDRQSLWDDEMCTIKDLSIPLSAWPERFRNYEMHPPLYFLQLRCWEKVAGTSLAARRADSAFWGVIGLALFFFLARRYLGSLAGLGAMALLAVSPYHLAYSQELRPYAMAITEGILGLIVLERCLQDPLTQTLSPQAGRGEFKEIHSPPTGGRGWRMRGVWVHLYLIWTALLYTHYWGSFVVLAQAIYGWLQTPDRDIKKRVLFTFLGSSALFTLWLPTLWNQLHFIGGYCFWVRPPAPVNLAETFVAFTGLFFHHASLAFRAPGPLAWNVFLGLVYLLLIGLGLNRGPRAAGIWLLVGVTVPYLISYIQPGIYVEYRYPSLMYPAFVLLVASGIQALPRRYFRRVTWSLLILSGLWGCQVYATSWQKANPKAVMGYIQQLKQPGTVVIRPVYFSPLFTYYDTGPTVVIDQDKLDSSDKRAALKGEKLVFVAFDVPNDPVRDALLSEFAVVSSRFFPGYAHLGITVYELR